MTEQTKKTLAQHICGIVMPISTIDGCSESHWGDVLEILTEAIEAAGFEGNLVSNADDVGIIQKRIIQNLYENPVVVCDVSGKNPNVMFELGMRLAFDKPTIIVKDDRTTYSFDTSPIEHLEYPRDLRFSKIVDFKQKLTEKLKATYEKSISDGSYTTFLKHFGEFKVAKIDKKEVTGQEFIIDELKSLRMAMRRLERSTINRQRDFEIFDQKKSVEVCVENPSGIDSELVVNQVSMLPGVLGVEVIERDINHKHFRVSLSDYINGNEIEKFIVQLTSNTPRPRRRPRTHDDKIEVAETWKTS